MDENFQNLEGKLRTKSLQQKGKKRRNRKGEKKIKKFKQWKA